MLKVTTKNEKKSSRKKPQKQKSELKNKNNPRSEITETVFYY